MPILSTQYFVSKTLCPGKLNRALRSVIGQFSPTPDLVHFSLHQSLADGSSKIKDPASYADLDMICDLAADPGLLRAWFNDADGNRMYFSLGGNMGCVEISVASESVENLSKFFDSIIAELGLEETESPLDRLRIAVKRSWSKPLSIALFVLGIVIAIVTNIASSMLPKAWELHLWLAWPLLVVLVIISIWLLLKSK